MIVEKYLQTFGHFVILSIYYGRYVHMRNNSVVRFEDRSQPIFADYGNVSMKRFHRGNTWSITTQTKELKTWDK